MKTSQVKISVDVKPGEISGIYQVPDQPKALIVLSHGAGAGMNHVFMKSLADELAKHDIATLRINLPYMEAGKKMPGSPKHAVEAIKRTASFAKHDYSDIPIYLAGKSYGGRMSSHLMADDNIEFIKGLIFYGFPLHAPGKPGVKRAKHLEDIKVSMLFLQGTNDKLADLNLLEPLLKNLKTSTLLTFEHADHSFKRPKKITKESLIPELAISTKDWIESQG